MGVQWEPGKVAREIRRIEAEDPNLKGRQIFGVGDPAIWASSGTESIGALMERERVYFEKGDHSPHRRQDAGPPPAGLRWGGGADAVCL